MDNDIEDLILYPETPLGKLSIAWQETAAHYRSLIKKQKFVGLVPNNPAYIASMKFFLEIEKKKIIKNKNKTLHLEG